MNTFFEVLERMSRYFYKSVTQPIAEKIEFALDWLLK